MEILRIVKEVKLKNGIRAGIIVQKETDKTKGFIFLEANEKNGYLKEDIIFKRLKILGQNLTSDWGWEIEINFIRYREECKEFEMSVVKVEKHLLKELIKLEKYIDKDRKEFEKFLKKTFKK